MTARDDSCVVRYLAKKSSGGAVVARLWQRRPYVVLPADGFLSYLQSLVDSPEGMPGLKEILPYLWCLPWDTCILDFGSSRDEAIETMEEFRRGPDDHLECNEEFGGAETVHGIFAGFNRVWAHVRPFDQFLSNPMSCPHIHRVAKAWHSQLLAEDPRFRNPVRWLMVEVYNSMHLLASDTDNLFVAPEISLINRDEPWADNSIVVFREPKQNLMATIADRGGIIAKAAKLIGKKMFDEILDKVQSTPKTNARLAACFFAYLANCDEHFVETKATPPTDRQQIEREKRTAEIKPWLRENLPSIILIDPARVNDYRGNRETHGTHTSPRPHHRRGHWKTLSSERFRTAKGRKLWIKPTWVGDTRWEHEGQTYKVLFPVAVRL